MQGEGNGFAAASATVRHIERDALRHELNYFADYGWSDRLTLGLDLHQNDTLSGHALLFARIPVATSSKPVALAVTLSAGGGHLRGHWDGMYRVTFSAGRTFRTRRGSGWASVDATYEVWSGAADPIWKLDATVGLNTAGALSPMLQIETSKSPQKPLSYAIIPSLRYKISARQEVVSGLEYKHAGQRSLGLRIALWHRF